MRTNIVIDESLMQQALMLSGCTTKKAVVDTALRLLVRMAEQRQIREARGALAWDGNLDDMRMDR